MDNFKNIIHSMRFLPDKMKKNGIFETDRMFCDLYCFEAGQAQAPHTHEGSDKVYFVVEGRGRFQIGDAEKELGKDEIAIAASGQQHGVKNASAERLVLLVFMAPKPAH